MKRKLNSNDVPEPTELDFEQTSIHDAIESSQFATFGLDPRLQQAVQRERFSKPTPVQLKTIPLAVSGKSALGMQEGADTLTVHGF